MTYQFEHHYMAGKWVAPHSGSVLAVEDPYRVESCGSAPLGDATDVDRAVEAALASFATWRTSSVAARQEVLRMMHTVLTANLEELAMLWATEVGTPITTARQATGFLPVKVLEDLIDILDEFSFSETLGSTRVDRVAVGPAAAITPWNYPISQFLIKCASAIAAGCSVVAKPSEIAPLCAFRLMQLFDDSGLPPGLINLVGGDGPGVGTALVNHPGIRFISFTGSTNTGRAIAAAAGGRLVRTCLELGGKSASIVLDEGALAAAVAGTVGSCSRNTGQTCTALTRLVVPASLVDHASELIVDHFSRLVIGDPQDESTVIGPLVSARQRDRALEIIASGEREGARKIHSTQVPDRGHFVSPTVFRDVTPSMRVAREEIFAPVLSIIAAPEPELLNIANDSEYGLAASVWGTDSEQALDFAERLEAGTITVNGGAFHPSAPYGGLKQSGLGRELGRYGLEEFLEYKAFHGGAR